MVSRNSELMRELNASSNENGLLHSRFMKFALVGSVGTGLHYAVLVMLVERLNFDAAVASGIGALFGLVCNYLLNRRITFTSEGLHWDLFPRYAAVAGIGFAVNFLLMWLLADAYGVRYLYAQLLATGLVLIWNYLANAAWTFGHDRTGLGAVPIWGWILLFSFTVRLLTLGAYPLIDPTEARYSEMARKMVETADWITPQFDYGVPFWGKPPLAVWLTALNLLAGGINEFAARFPAFLLGMCSCLVVWILASARQPLGEAWKAPAILGSSLLFFVMAGSVAMDQVLSLAITLAMGAFWRALHDRRKIWGYVFFVALAMGLLAKGPIALILTGLPIGSWVLARREWRRCWSAIPWIGGSLLMLLLAVPWFVIAEHKTPGFLEYFLIGEHWKRFTEPGWQGDLYGSGRVHVRGTIWLYGLLAAMPWTPIFLWCGWRRWRDHARSRRSPITDGWGLYCLLWLLSPLTFFTLSANVIWTYVLPAMPAFALLLGDWLHTTPLSVRGWRVGYVVPGLLVMALLVPESLRDKVMNTQKDIVAAYRVLRTDEEAPLHYLKSKPFSAQFYTAGHIDELDPATLTKLATTGASGNYYVIRDRDWEILPTATRQLLHVVFKSGRFLLASRG